jgi:hypothetical protein
VVVVKSIIFWDITPCSPLSVNRRFGGTYRLHLQGRRSSARNQQANRYQIRITLNNKTTKDTQKKFYKAVAVHVLTYGSEIRAITTTTTAATETVDKKSLMSVADYTRKDQIRNN